MRCTAFAKLCVLSLRCFLFRLDVFHRFYLLFALACECASICVFPIQMQFHPFSTVSTVNGINLYAQTVCCCCCYYCYPRCCLPLSISIHSSAIHFGLQRALFPYMCSVYTFYTYSAVKFKIYAIFCSLRQKAFNSFSLTFHSSSVQNILQNGAYVG